ncbi:ABC transporter permease [Nocardioides mangrovicus]|uniref:Cell division protein FtsX n=1 Tax=Nocardioides mangrovicus TaxID=2478913 RepID=A0A3L8P5Z4_9ACTN|nr:permease-like cell division protein FtsX [Nocardioides mangrovicus]RLV49838.1 ABC transporter permease [Nocardioides mangrovicus]
MQLRYVFSEAAIGLRRNLTMTIALVVTMFVSLTLVGMGLLLHAQADKAEQRWGSQLQITVYLCNANARAATCAGGEVTDPQKSAVVQVLKTHPEVKNFSYRSKQQAYDALQKLAKQQDTSSNDLYSTVTVNDMNQSYTVTLKDPRKYQGVEQAIAGLDGVENVQDLHNLLSPIYKFLSAMLVGALVFAGVLLVAAVLEVGNTIRLTAHARRREIGIMRLVGAGSLSIQLPFLMETLVAAMIGIVLSAGALAFFVWYVVYGKLRTSNIVYWIDYWDLLRAIAAIAVLGIVMTVIPTLLMTRKYLKV